MDILKELFKMQDLKYRDFHSGLMPTVDKALIIGIRVPMLRKFAKEISGLNEAEEFLNTLPHKYYEENNLHAFLIEQIKDFEEALARTESFLPYIDNWATCDMFLPSVFKKNPHKLLPYIEKWIKSEKTYTVRYAIGLLMSLFLDEHFDKVYLETVAQVKSDEYYINMMIAWYFATALAKQYDDAIVYINENTLDAWVHNKTIQKAIESNRIDIKTKESLRKKKRSLK